MNSRSIRFRLVAWYGGVMVGAFILLGGLMYMGLELYLKNSLGQTQTLRGRQIAETLLLPVEQTGERHVVDEINSWFTPQTNDRFIRITRGDGSVLYISSQPMDRGFDPQKVPPHPWVNSAPRQRVELMPDGGELLIASVHSELANGKQYLVEVGASMAPIHELLHRFILLQALTLAAALVLAIAGGYFLVRRALAPVDQISSSAEQITLHNLKERLPVANTGDELERLAVSLNNMITRLEDALEHNRRFIADASHELRTPLTIMRGELEGIIFEMRTQPETQGMVASVLEEVERLARIVEGLFAVSRLDAGEAQQEWRTFDLTELASSTAEQMCLLAEDKNICITTNAAVPVPVNGDRARVKQVVVNLLDNAIKYTREGGKVELTVNSANDKAILTVADNGIGIPVEARAHIFERFFRVEKARSRELGGAGLGLSIVKSICTAHGGSVTVQSAENSGSCFRVELPLAKANGNK